MPYISKATEIIKDSIKSAIFIDEKALEPYAVITKDQPGITEEQMSIQLFSNFKEQNISLAVHKFTKADITNSTVKDYLFENRDLVLLDWKLDGNDGEEYSLQLLADIVKRPHLHFCCIYTSVKDIDNVFNSVLGYFSGISNNDREQIQLNLAGEEKEIHTLLPSILTISHNRNEAGIGKNIGEVFRTHGVLLKRVKNEIPNATDNKCLLIKLGTAFSKYILPAEAQPCPELVSVSEKVIIIENTIITILQKDAHKPNVLIDTISKHVAASKNSFTQLLGLEMQNIFSKKGAFVDSNLISVSKEALLFHRKQLRDDDGIDLPFKELIKEVLVENAKLNIRTENLSLLNDEFLDAISKDLPEPDINDIIKVNVFYNATTLHGTKCVNFGDVFKDDATGNYFVCITSLCDCIRPEKINNSFYFAKGEKFNDKHAALELGDTAFISYMPNGDLVRWSGVESGVAEELHKFKPIYIKPESYIIPVCVLNEEGLLKLHQLDSNGVPKVTSVRYISTIKPIYAQRIANHAFSYPVRVGIDFIKTKRKAEKNGN